MRAKGEAIQKQKYLQNDLEWVYTQIQCFIATHFERLKVIFHLKWRRPPHLTAIYKIIIGVSPEAIETAFQEYAKEVNAPSSEGTRHMCFDGKALNGSFSHAKNQRAFHVFQAFCTQTQLVLAHIHLDDKKSEIPAFQAFLLQLDLKGVVVTADAIHCQKKHLNVPKRQELISLFS